jgi:YidC/Oxa1 family membrane protein insertase
MNSMKKMQELQPRMKVLQEKYADDKEMQSKKVMELYKENNINPAAGCLPLLIQLPIFIMLYSALTRHGFSNATFLTIHLDGSLLSTIADAIKLVDPITSLPFPKEQLGFVMVMYTAITKAPALLFANWYVWLPNTVLLVVISFLTWLQQHLTSGNNPQMAMMNWFMPIFMTFICLTLPGGVLLYWGVSSLMGVAPQIAVMRKARSEMRKKPVLSQEKPTHKAE